MRYSLRRYRPEILMNNYVIKQSYHHKNIVVQNINNKKSKKSLFHIAFAVQLQNMTSRRRTPNQPVVSRLADEHMNRK